MNVLNLQVGSSPWNRWMQIFLEFFSYLNNKMKEIGKSQPFSILPFCTNSSRAVYCIYCCKIQAKLLKLFNTVVLDTLTYLGWSLFLHYIQVGKNAVLWITGLQFHQVLKSSFCLNCSCFLFPAMPITFFAISSRKTVTLPSSAFAFVSINSSHLRFPRFFYRRPAFTLKKW